MKKVIIHDIKVNIILFNHIKQLTVNNFVSILQEKLIDDITKEIDYRYSDEGIKKELSENEYYENGEVA